MRTFNGIFLTLSIWVAVELGIGSSFSDHGYIGIAVLPSLILLGVIIGHLMAWSAQRK